MKKRTMKETSMCLLLLLALSVTGCEKKALYSREEIKQVETATDSTNTGIYGITIDNYKEIVSENLKKATFMRSVTPADVGFKYWDDVEQQYKVGEVTFTFSLGEKNLTLLGKDQNTDLWCLLDEENSEAYFIVSDFNPEMQESGTVDILGCQMYLEVKACGGNI